MPVSVSVTPILTVQLVGGWAWVNASLLGTLLHLWSYISELFYMQNKSTSTIKQMLFFPCDPLMWDPSRVTVLNLGGGPQLSRHVLFLQLFTWVWWIWRCNPCDKRAAAVSLGAAPPAASLFASPGDISNWDKTVMTNTWRVPWKTTSRGAS